MFSYFQYRCQIENKYSLAFKNITNKHNSENTVAVLSDNLKFTQIYNNV